MTGATNLFPEHLALVDSFLRHRLGIAERIENALLNVRDKDTARRRDRPFFERTFSACFFNLPGLSPELSRLQGHLAARHLADGFEPVASETRYVNELDPLELILRAYEHWDRHRWPGRSGRLAYAQTLYAVFMLRLLEGLSLRIWDEDLHGASTRLDELQTRLDRLNGPDSPVAFVRDAGWLIQISQGPLTKHLKPYLDVAERTAGSLSGTQRLAVHTAGARLAGGHLRSQLRYRVWQTGRSSDDPANLAFTRNSNALDGALMVRDLVPLLDAYRGHLQGRKDERLDLADAIVQGLSADPELFVTRLDLLAPYVTVEDLFVERRNDGVGFTAMGDTQRLYLERYTELLGEVAGALRSDTEAFDPARAEYSPQGITYGFCADVLSNMAQETLHRSSSDVLSLEDTFDSRGDLDRKLARATAWTSLPRRPGEREHFEHSLDVAAENYARVAIALEQRAARPASLNASDSRSARIFLGAGRADAARADEYCVTSDPSRAHAAGPTIYPKDQLIVDRHEGRYLASVCDRGEWFGISKAILTLHTAQGVDATISDVPSDAVDVLRLTCPGIATTAEQDALSNDDRPR